MHHAATHCTTCTTRFTTCLTTHLPSGCALRWKVCCSVLQRVAACCSMLQCVAVCCSVLQTGVSLIHFRMVLFLNLLYCNKRDISLQLATTHCNTLATHYSILYHTAAYCNALQHITIYCNTLWLCIAQRRIRATAICNSLQHTAARCNILQHTATHSATHVADLRVDQDIAPAKDGWERHLSATRCNTLQHTATHSMWRQSANHSLSLRWA